MWKRALGLLGIIAASVFLGYLIGNMQPDTTISYKLPAESPFLVSNLSIQPQKVQPNEVVTISVTVTNRRHTWGIYSLVLKIDGRREEEMQTNVGAGDSQDVSFFVTRSDIGCYQVFINGLSGSFEVTEPTY